MNSDWSKKNWFLHFWGVTLAFWLKIIIYKAFRSQKLFLEMYLTYGLPMDKKDKEL